MRSWQFSESECRLESGDDVAHLTPKAAAVLGCLVRRRGKIVSREELLEEVWAGLNVTPDLVREYIFDLRSVLYDDAKSPAYIETVHRKGFRLIGDVQVAASDKGRPANDSRAIIAVLRPEDFSEDKRWRRFADGLAEDVTTNLARFPDLAVIARHSTFAVARNTDLREVAATLGADYVLDSSITVVEDHLRARFQLIDGQSGSHIWAQRFDRKFENLTNLSDEIASGVANALGGLRGEIHRAELRLVRRKPASDLNAYEHFIIAREHEHVFDAESTRKGLEHVDLSISADPEFARSWLLRRFLMERAADLCSELDPKTCRINSVKAISRAYTLDPRDGLVLLEIGLGKAIKGDLYGATDAIARGTDLGRNHADVSALAANAYAMIVGDIAEAESLLENALKLNPTPPSWYRFSEARVAFFSGDFERCEQVSLGASDFLATLSYRSLAQAMLGKADKARASRAELSNRFPTFDFMDHAKTFPIVAEIALIRYRAAIAELSAL